MTETSINWCIKKKSSFANSRVYYRWKASFLSIKKIYEGTSNCMIPIPSTQHVSPHLGWWDSLRSPLCCMSSTVNGNTSQTFCNHLLLTGFLPIFVSCHCVLPSSCVLAALWSHPANRSGLKKNQHILPAKKKKEKEKENRAIMTQRSKWGSLRTILSITVEPGSLQA